MRIVHVSTYDADGGAARAAYALHHQLTSMGIDSHMIVLRKQTDDPAVEGPKSVMERAYARIVPVVDATPLSAYPRRSGTTWSVGWAWGSLRRRVTALQPDVVHLHWVCGGLMRIGDLARLGRPVVWTLHDMWPLTGGCHFSGGCIKYQTACGRCPQLDSGHEWDLSRVAWLAKRHSFARSEITAVAVSHWMAECARASPLLSDKPCEVIPNGLDTRRFKPASKAVARAMLDLPQAAKLIAFGAASGTRDPRKGFGHLQAALRALQCMSPPEPMHLVVFGPASADSFGSLACPVRYVGRLHDDISLALLYSAADVVVVPSEQESFGLVALEALACGTPVVAFRCSGLLDVVQHGHTGYLAEPFDPCDLARGIAWVLESEARRDELGKNARSIVESSFSITQVAERYVELYERLAQDE